MRIDYKVSKLGINQLIPIQSIVFAISLFDQQIQETRNFNKLSPTPYMLFSNRIHPPLAIFYLLLCMIPQTCTIAKPRNLCNGSCTLIPLVWRRTRGSTISSWHRASASSFSFFFFFRPPHDRALHFLNPFHRAEDYFTILRCHGISCVYDATLTSLPPGEEREKWWDVDEEPSSNAS